MSQKNFFVCALCDDPIIANKVALMLDELDVYSIHLTHASLDLVSFTFLKEIGFDLVIVDEEYLSKTDLLELHNAWPKAEIAKIPCKSDRGKSPGWETELLENIFLTLIQTSEIFDSHKFKRYLAKQYPRIVNQKSPGKKE